MMRSFKLDQEALDARKLEGQDRRRTGGWEIPKRTLSQARACPCFGCSQRNWCQSECKDFLNYTREDIR